MPYKPIPPKTFEKYIKFVDWKLEKGSIDWNIYNEKGDFVCAIIISHGKRAKSEVTAFSVNKTKKAFEERGLKWPPNRK
jgi:hypothetical protein